MIWALPLMALVLVDRVRLTSAGAPSPAETNGHASDTTDRFWGLPWWLILYFAWSFISFFVYHTLARA
jgi:hypothetical protein